MPNINHILRDLRLKAKLSITQLSKSVAISRSILSDYELGVLKPSSDHLNTLARFYNCTIEFIVGAENSSDTELLNGNDLPQELLDLGITSLSVAKGYRLSAEDAKELIADLKSQNIIK